MTKVILELKNKNKLLRQFAKELKEKYEKQSLEY